MKKIYISERKVRQKEVFKSFILTLFVLIIFSGVFPCSLYAQDGQAITFEMKQATIDQVITKIESTTDYSFAYRSKDLPNEPKRDYSFRQSPIATVMDRLLESTNLEWSLSGSIITITPRVDKRHSVTIIASSDEHKELTVRGRVTGENKEPVAGATVQLKGVAVGAATNSNGEYSLTFKEVENPVFVFSFIGLETTEVPVGNKSVVNAVMKDNMASLHDVVVTGYSNIRESSFTGTAVTISQDELLKASRTDVMKAIQAFDPSFRIKENNQWGSDPNALPEMYIRGESGFGNFDELGRDPLAKANLKDNPNLPTFIMDGFEISATTLYDFDPTRIESVTILKDAAATALYGSRAANGVIIITTVTPKPGKLHVAYNMVGDIVSPDLSDYNLLNASEKLEVERLAGYYDATNMDSHISEFDLRREYNRKRMNIEEGVNTDWLAKPLRTVFNHRHSLNIEGGSDHLRFGADVQFSSQDGVMKGSMRDRFGAGIYLQYTIGDFTIRNQFMFSQTQSEESPYGNFGDYAEQLPYDKFKDENGNYLEKPEYWGTGSDQKKINPLYETTLHNFDKNKREEYINNLSVNWRIMDDLLFKAQFSVSRDIDKSDRFFDPLSRRSGNIFQLDHGNISSGTYYLSNRNSYAFDFNATMAYNKFVNDHNINAVAGVNVRQDKTTGDHITYVGFPSGALSSPMYAEKVYNNKGSFTEDTKRLIGFLASVNYSYKDIYLFDASLRFDGSSAFGADKRFATFWSGGVGLNIHNYRFMKESVEFINQLKVRLSYGQTGKANFPAYDSRTSYRILSDAWYKTGFGSELIALGNPSLTWETTNTLDFGAELSMFNNRLYLKGTVYDKRTVDLITSVTVPISTGFMSYKDNIGEISNKGFEIDLRVVPVKTKDFTLILNANLAHNKNRIEKISDSMRAYNEGVMDMYHDNTHYDEDRLNEEMKRNKATPFLQYVEGGSMSSIFGVRSLGIDPATGEEVFLSHTGELTNVWRARDQVVLGTREPDAQGAFGFNMQYKQFSLYTSFLYEFGGQRYNQTLVDKVENVNVYAHNVDSRVMSERWMKPGDRAKYRKISTNRNTPNFTQPTSRFVQNYNSIRFSSIEFGYELPRNIAEKLHLSMVRFTVGMNDVFHRQSIQMERGLSYPYARTVNFSIRIVM